MTRAGDSDKENGTDHGTDKGGPRAGQTGRPVSGSANERADGRLLEVLVCPLTKTTLAYNEARQELVSRRARLAFPIRRGVPHLVLSEAREIED